MDHFSLSFGFAVGFEFLRTCSSFPIDTKDAVLGETWLGVATLGVVFLVVGVLLLAGCLCCRRTGAEGFKEFRNSVSTTNLNSVGVGFVNPGLSSSQCSELAIFPPPGASAPAVTFEPLPNILPPTSGPQSPGHPPGLSKPPAFNTSPNQEFSIADWFGKDANFPRDQLHYLRECGRGWFGRVVEGEARGIGENGRNCKVVVRILREDATPSEQKFFLNEVKPFRDLAHPNVLKLVGRCLDTDPYLILLESCSSGDLKSFLCGNVASRAALCEQGICLRMMCDIATGLQQILQHGFVHTDLAARNCLVTSDLTVKVGDYGTSIEMYKDDYYIAGDVALPIRWCAPESLHCTDTTIETKQVTACANVWSFGVLLWEICEFGALPYTSLSDDQVIVRVLGKERLKLPPPTYPSLHTAHLYSLMQMCWREESQRALLEHVIAMLRHLKASRTLDSEDDFERRWDTLKPNTIPVTDNHTLDALTIRSDFDSGVDLDIKASDLDSSKLKLSMDDSPATTSPQLSVASSSGGEFFSPSSKLKRQLSPSLTNLRGSFEDIAVEIALPSPQHQTPILPSVSTSSFAQSSPSCEADQFDSWLQGVDTTNEEDVKFVKKISEAIRDLDDALALEKTSSSSEESSRHESPVKETNVSDQNPVLDFRLGPMSSMLHCNIPLIHQPDSLQEDSLIVRRDSSSDTEEETWRGRIERGEFSEKVKEKSRSVADLMILTHIENSSDESDSLPSLTRQYSIEKKLRFGNLKTLAAPMMTSIGFGSEGNIKGAILGEEFQESLKQLQTAWKIRDSESRKTSLTAESVPNESPPSSSNDKEVNFLGDTASEKENSKERSVTESDNKIDGEIILNLNYVVDTYEKSDMSSQNHEWQLRPKEDETLDNNSLNKSSLNDSVQESRASDSESKCYKTSSENNNRVISKDLPQILDNTDKQFKVSLKKLNTNCNRNDDSKDIDVLQLESDAILRKEVVDASFLVQLDKEIPRGSSFINEDSGVAHREILKGNEEQVDKIIENSTAFEQECDRKSASGKIIHSEPIIKHVVLFRSETVDNANTAISKNGLAISQFEISESNLENRIEDSTNVEVDKLEDETKSAITLSTLEYSKSELNDLDFIRNEVLHSTRLLSENSKESSKLNDNVIVPDDTSLSIEKKIESVDIIMNTEENCKESLSDEKVEDEIVLVDKDLLDESISDRDILNSTLQSPVDANNSLIQDNLDSKETSLSEVESSSQSSGQTMTVVENDLLKAEEVSDSNYEIPYQSTVNSSLPEIVVTEANESDLAQEAENVSTNIEYKPRRQIRILLSHDSSDDTDSENDGDVFDDRKFPVVLAPLSSSPPKHNAEENEGNFLEDVEIPELDLKKSFDSSDSKNMYNFNEKNDRIDKLKSINVEVKSANVDENKLNSAQPIMASANINESYSVILGSCEDYTLDYFKGLKTTSGKPGLFDSDCSTNDFSKSDSEMEDTDLSSTDREDNINNWDTFLTNSLRERTQPDDSFRNVQFSIQQLDSIGSSQTDVNSEDTVMDDENEESLSHQLNKRNVDFCKRENNNLINEKNTDDRILNRDFESRNNCIIPDGMGRNFNLFDNFSTCDHDRQMNEVKSRLEDVAKLSEGFQLKGDEEEDEGKLLTPDDERSSDSGFRDKGSLSESVEDACDEKYNLEDIEAELEEAYIKTNESKYFTMHDENSSSSGEFSVPPTFPNPASFSVPSSKPEIVNSSEQLSEIVEKEDEKSKNPSGDSIDSEEVECLPTHCDSSEEPKSGWFLHPPPGDEHQGHSSGWYPTPVVQESSRDDTSYVSFHLDEEFVTAIRNELREKLPCAQLSLERKEGDEDNSPEEERTDMVIEYGGYQVPLSPILEERESVSSNQSSLILDLQGSNATSGKSSPILMLEQNDGLDDEANGRKFEEDIKTALNLYNSESIESDDIDIIVEDLENKQQMMKVREEKQEEYDDLLIVNTETNEVRLLESPRPKSHLAFIRRQKEIETVNSSPTVNDSTFTPDSISPISSGSSRTGVALSFSSPDTGNLSNFLSPSSLNSELVDSEYLNSLDQDSCTDRVEEISIMPNSVCTEIIEKLRELGAFESLEDTDSSQTTSSDKTVSTPGFKVTTEVVEANVNTNLENSATTIKIKPSENPIVDTVRPTEKAEESVSRGNEIARQENENSDNAKDMSVTSLSLDKLLMPDPQPVSEIETVELKATVDDCISKIEESKDWLKSVLLPLTKPAVQNETVDEVIERPLPAKPVLPKDSWPSSDELIPSTLMESQLSQKTVDPIDSASAPDTEKKKSLELNSTLALLSPNLSYGPDSNSSMVSSFSSTPTFDTTKSLADAQMSLSISSNDGEESHRTVPSLRALASEILRLHKKILKPVSVSTDETVQSKRLNNLTLALDTSSVSKAPMPSPEDADKGIWRPTVSQLMDLTSQDLDADDLMTTSFIEADGERYTPDWESDTSDADSEDQSSSSGEFIWKPQDDILEPHGMARIEEEDEDEEENEEAADDSSCGSATEFVPSIWDKGAAPTKSALRAPDKKQESRKRVCFKKQKYHCVYEYPCEPSDSEEEEIDMRRRTWETPTNLDYACFTDWELAEGEADLEQDGSHTDSREHSQRGAHNQQQSDCDFYRLSGVDYDVAQMTTDDGEFFISSSARPFQQMGFSDVSSEFFPGGRLSFDLDNDGLSPSKKDNNALNGESKENERKACENFIDNERKLVNSNSSNSLDQVGVGGLRHTREWLKLDLPASFSAQAAAGGEANVLDNAEDSGIDSQANEKNTRNIQQEVAATKTNSV